MNLKYIIAGSALAGLITLGACSPKVKQVAASTGVLAMHQDTIAYAFGLLNGESFRQSMQSIPGDSLDKVRVLEGFTQAFLGRDAKLSQDTARTLFQNYVQEVQEKEMAELRKRNEAALEENKSREGVQVTSSGLQYRVLRDADGPRPTVQDTVVVHYAGRTIDGKEFDSSYKRGEPATFGLLQVIPGWTEGVCLMPKGSKYEFYIPASLAYGERGAGGAIPPYATLVFEVELVDIKPYTEPKTKELEVEPIGVKRKKTIKKKK